MSNDIVKDTSSNEVARRVERPFAVAAQGDSLGIVGVAALKYIKAEYIAYRVGEKTEEIVPLGTEFAVDMHTMCLGFAYWEGGLPAEARSVRVSSGERMPQRRDLGDNDQSLWPLDNGVAKDPWAPDSRVVMIALGDAPNGTYKRGDKLTFYSSSWGGRKAFEKLCRDYDTGYDEHPDEMPVIALGTYKRPSKKYGKIDSPTLEIVGWSTSAELQNGKAASGKQQIKKA